MCGIIGLISNKALHEQPRFLPARDRMAHRGPDASGEFLSSCGRVLFGHRRLAIVDLSAQGRQPMSDIEGDLTIVFNGEIYNHRELRSDLLARGLVFKSHSDTEVILQSYKLWGEEAFAKFNGPFAIAIFDRRGHRVVLARDRAGEKPLFYRYADHQLHFASELTALREFSGCAPAFDERALVSYLSRGYPIAERSLIRECFSLKPGTFARFDLQDASFVSHGYWQPPLQHPIASEANPDTLVEELEILLSDAVRLQLNCDVPACVLLSGGVDSSLLTALASRHAPELKTFTVRFPGFPAFDETESARLIARHFSTDHTEIEGVDLSPDLFLQLADRMDTPINDSSLIPTFLVNRAVSEHCKVAIGGDGGDELFGGYKHYSRMLALDHYAGWLLPILRGVGTKHLKGLVPRRYRARNWFASFGHDLKRSVPNIREIFDLESVAHFLPKMSEDALDEKRFEADWSALSSGQGSILRNCCLSDFQTYLLNSILVKSDRASMLNSVEARAPFLDARVIDFSFQKVPDTLKSSVNNRKIILKRLGRKLLPESFDFKRKLGFNWPLGNLIRQGRWNQLFGDIILGKCAFLDYGYRERLFSEHVRGINHTDKLFGLALLMRWAKTNGVSLHNDEVNSVTR